MVCRSCGYEAPGRPKFCQECGAPVPAECPHCGSANPPNARFCGECGGSLARAAAEEEKAEDQQAAADGDRRNASVFFADISGYTAFSAQQEPDDVLLFMAKWYRRVKQISDKYDGFFKRAEGDCVMIVVGAPIACEDHAERACRLALDVHAAFPRFVEEQRSLVDVGDAMDLHS